MIFQLSRSTAGPRAQSVGLLESFRWNHRLAIERLRVNEIAVPTMLPTKTIKNPHHKPKKKPPPTARMPPGSRRILQAAKSSGEKTAPTAPPLIPRRSEAR